MYFILERRPQIKLIIIIIMSPDLNIPSQFNSNDFITTCLLDPVPTKLLKELLPVAEEPLLNIINSSLTVGHVQKTIQAGGY